MVKMLNYHELDTKLTEKRFNPMFSHRNICMGSTFGANYTLSNITQNISPMRERNGRLPSSAKCTQMPNYKRKIYHISLLITRLV